MSSRVGSSPRPQTWPASSAATPDASYSPVGNGPAESTILVENPYQQASDGLTTMEAEHFSWSTTSSGKTWDLVHPIGSSGGDAMQALPNTGVTLSASGYGTTSPRLDYSINFTQAGTYHIWVRAMAATGNDNSLHIGVDGAELTTTANLTVPSGGSWQWSKTTGAGGGSIATVTITTPGVHTLNLWMREDGLVVDRLLMTLDASFVPTGIGPPESPR